MKTVRKISALLCVAALLLCLCACGDKGEYKIIEKLGEKNYISAFRLDDALAQPVTAAISVLAANGELSRLSQQWLGEDLTTLKGSADALEKLEGDFGERTLIVGVESDHAPLSYYEGDELVGMSVDLANAVGSLLGWEIKLQPISADEVETQLSSGNIDCALGVGSGTVSSSKYTVGETYMSSTMVVAVSSDSKVGKLRDLKGEKIGSIQDPDVLAAISGNDKAVKYVDSVTVYLSPTRCVNALSQGWCSAVAMDSIMLEHYFAN